MECDIGWCALAISIVRGCSPAAAVKAAYTGRVTYNALDAAEMAYYKYEHNLSYSKVGEYFGIAGYQVHWYLKKFCLLRYEPKPAKKEPSKPKPKVNINIKDMFDWGNKNTEWMRSEEVLNILGRPEGLTKNFIGRELQRLKIKTKRIKGYLNFSMPPLKNEFKK